MDNETSYIQIIPYYAHPHVHTVILDNTFYTEDVAARQEYDLPFSTVIVTGADRGIDNTFVKLSSYNTKLAIFGRGNFTKYGQPSIQCDELFNGQTNVWFCRVLPSNATYSNLIVLAHYRQGKILDDLNQETGKFRMEIKFSVTNASKPTVTDGAKEDIDIYEFAKTLEKTSADPVTGYLTVPLFYIRSIGRGKYGNNYNLSFDRDSDAEKEYSVKMYKFSLLDTNVVTRIINIFAGALYQTISNSVSTLISDVLDQFSTGSCPVSIYSFEDSVDTLWNFYQKIVALNAAYITNAGGSSEDNEEIKFALKMKEAEFDPVFGIRLNSRTAQPIPYYRNYTIKPTGPYIPPDLTIPNVLGATKPLNKVDWISAFLGARVLVVADPLHNGYRWMYTVDSIDANNGNIVYDNGIEVAIDDDQYDGINLKVQVGNALKGGSDGEFEEITVNSVTRTPNEAEMKLLLAREQVKAFRGEKDRKILSPARVNLDFIFDANYNMTKGDLDISNNTIPIYSNSTVLTDKDAQMLAILASNNAILDFTDLNVKKAIYDLNEFRNRNGMTINLEQGAGCLLHLDTNYAGTKASTVSYELLEMIKMLAEFDGRQTSIDLGYYQIYDPGSGKKITVTATYYLAKNLIPHLLKNGLNKPFTYSFAQLNSINTSAGYAVGDMIRDSFRPDIDLIDWDAKEELYLSRLNYYLTNNEGRTVQRASQNTRQREASALLEENNVRVLNTLKKNLEKACRGYLYEWNEPEVRKGYTDSQMQIYRPWIGTMVQDIDIRFDANEWEQERMIMHCYVIVKFRDIIKRIILEINIQRPTYVTEGGE